MTNLDPGADGPGFPFEPPTAGCAQGRSRRPGGTGLEYRNSVGMWFQKNKKTVKIDGEHVPVWYLVFDESGRPYYDRGKDENGEDYQDGGRDFVMGAILTQDPEALADIALKKPSNTNRSKKKSLAPGKGELKHSRSSPKVKKETMEEIKILPDTLRFVVSTPLEYRVDGPEDNRFPVYANSYVRIINAVAEMGPEGIYKIRLDDTHDYDRKLMEDIAHGAFDGTGKDLSEGRAVLTLDSELAPVIQTVDMMVGEYADSLRNGDEKFAARNKIIVCNRKKGKSRQGGRHRIQNRR